MNSAELADDLADAASVYSAWVRDGYPRVEKGDRGNPAERLRQAMRRISIEMRSGVVYGLWDPHSYELRYVGVTTRPPMSRLAEHRRALHSPVGRWIAVLGQDPLMGALTYGYGEDLFIAERDEIFKQTWAGHDLLNVDHDQDHALWSWAVRKHTGDVPDFLEWHEDGVVRRVPCPACRVGPWEDCRTHPDAATLAQGGSHIRRCAAYLRHVRGQCPPSAPPQAPLNYQARSADGP